MTLGDALGLTDAQERRLVRGLQLGLAALLGYGVVTFQFGISGTAGLALGITLLPAWLRWEYGYSMDAGLVLWITAAVLLHTMGSLWLYETYQWYDEIAHTVSAAVIAGLGYAAFRAFELYSDEMNVPSTFRSVFIVVFVLAIGVIWEVLEFALGGAVVTVYGIDDIVTDFVFNAVGAVIVAIWGTGYVSELVGFFGRRLRSKPEN
ncbi:glycoside hydrolase family protein [Natrinema versiforme]|uniref:Membrane-spanning protein n=1 Tax=Natrinema versiforme JCM 10478 TaxID=1227496 RepID=L9XP65_9EURY|nr:hypothetical protein [Natrinema versiforme]ELY63221.1 hypothetical protein C489_19186 [Natrinema versiforme JCM 10478]